MLRYSSGAVLEGSNVREALETASAILVAEGYPAIVVVDGDRSYDKQVQVFLERYVLVGNVGGRRVYDFRWWEGRQYARVSPEGTVAAPSRTAPHVARLAADLGWPYNNRSTGAHRRLQQIGPGLGLTWTGVNFGEDWHWESSRGVGRVGMPASIEIPKEWDELVSEQQMENLIRRVNNESRINDYFIVSYASESGRNGIVLAGLGYWHPMTGEQWEHFTWLKSQQGMTLFNGMQVFTPINDRSWDILREMCLQDGVAEGEGFDYARIESMVTKGNLVVAPSIDYARLAQALKDAGVTSSNSVDVAKAVRAELAANPLR
ncbi:hypothetical protein QE418_003371 [Microbacterium testaceum]|uniref:hypothetical protein n=1 Tax=Microbacterium TaxID=33882 RepID=UPI002784EDC2|nr:MULTISPECIES: hypothetical protein [Microbacterium]MDQ1113923.1 hypothetical protein [Microbacterium testaceum]MDR6098970.1 hypothetical protein [Microbacterium sp. SORGH_AS_0454]